jgi:hypothetical protein
MNVVVEFCVPLEKLNSYRHVCVGKRIALCFSAREIVLRHVFEIDVH